MRTHTIVFAFIALPGCPAVAAGKPDVLNHRQ